MNPSLNVRVILSTALAITLALSQDVNAETPVEAALGETLSVEEKAALADLDSSDRFRNVTKQTKQLSAAKARAYVGYTERRAKSLYGLTRLELSNVTEISVEAAKELAQHRGWLFLNGLTSISDEAAEALSQHHGRLYLNGLKTLSDAAAKALSQHELVRHRENGQMLQRGGLHLDGLTTLSDEAVRALAQQKGDLWLRGLTTLSDEAAAVLRQKRDLRLPVNLKGEEKEAANSPKLSQHTYVYAKIILPMRSPAKREYEVESWIAKKLRKRGETELRAVTDWVRLSEGGENSASVWNATVDGKAWGCPVSGSVAKNTDDGKLKVELTGWAPFAPKIKGDTLSAEAGSRGIAAVDTGAGDQDGRAFVALVVGPGKATHDHAEENLAAIPWREFSPAKLRALRNQEKPVLVFCEAAWDVNSQILEHRLFTDKRVIDAVKQLEFVPLHAHFTNPSKDIEGFLRDVGGRTGEATIVVFHGPNDQAPITLQINNASKSISTGDLLDAMKRRGEGKD